MQKFILGAVIGASLLCALPASAQVVVHESVGVGVAQPHPHWRHRHHRHWRGSYASCTVQHVRTRRKDGTVVVTTRRTC